MAPKSTLKFYLLGLVPTVIGAAAVNPTDSLAPLAMGSAITVMTTAAVIRKIWLHKRPRP